jgi:NSS family neurotransmitter:Na+ symporter
MIGVAVGLGNVWRFPYMVGRFGGAAFVLLYLFFALVVGVPALMAEWSLGRETRRGSVGAFQRAGLPGGRWLGWLLFGGVAAATGYYCNAIGWVLYHAGAELGRFDGSGILPPDSGFSGRAFLTQLLMTGAVVGGSVTILLRGVRKGIEGVSKLFTPLLFLTLLILMTRSLTLQGSGAGLEWFILKFRPQDITAPVTMAALGQVVFSLALGGTFMVIYGSYLDDEESVGPNALFTVLGDTGAGLLAGLAIFPAVFALGMEPGSGPGLVFQTLPAIFRSLPGGWIFGALFFLSLGGVAFLSAVAAFEVLIAGLTDNTELSRRGATLIMAGVVLLLALPPMVNMRIFLPWDLAFGSGLQSAGVLFAVLAFGWALDRATAIRQLGGDGAPLLHLWIRWVIPGAILMVGGWWLASEVLPLVTG